MRKTPNRSILVNTVGKDPQWFASNQIETTKYTLLTFLPRNLYEQFKIFANIFFLALAVAQFFPVFQSIDPYVAAVPLFLVIAGISMI
jgi:hypothetical protein